MNKDRRKQLDEALKLLEEAQAIADQAMDIIEAVREDESEAFENLPEGLQQAERGEAMSAAISALENIDLNDIFDDARGGIEEAQQA